MSEYEPMKRYVVEKHDGYTFRKIGQDNTMGGAYITISIHEDFDECKNRYKPGRYYIYDRATGERERVVNHNITYYNSKTGVWEE